MIKDLKSEVRGAIFHATGWSYKRSRAGGCTYASDRPFRFTARRTDGKQIEITETGLYEKDAFTLFLLAQATLPRAGSEAGR